MRQQQSEPARRGVAKTQRFLRKLGSSNEGSGQASQLIGRASQLRRWTRNRNHEKMGKASCMFQRCGDTEKPGSSARTAEDIQRAPSTNYKESKVSSAAAKNMGAHAIRQWQRMPAQQVRSRECGEAPLQVAKSCSRLDAGRSWQLPERRQQLESLKPWRMASCWECTKFRYGKIVRPKQM